MVWGFFGLGGSGRASGFLGAHCWGSGRFISERLVSGGFAAGFLVWGGLDSGLRASGFLDSGLSVSGFFMSGRWESGLCDSGILTLGSGPGFSVGLVLGGGRFWGFSLSKLGPGRPLGGVSRTGGPGLPGLPLPAGSRGPGGRSALGVDEGSFGRSGLRSRRGGGGRSLGASTVLFILRRRAAISSGEPERSQPRLMRALSIFSECRPGVEEGRRSSKGGAKTLRESPSKRERR